MSQPYDSTDFASLESLVQYTQHANICWLSLRYLAVLAERRDKLPRRQDLPSEAVYNLEAFGSSSFLAPSREKLKAQGGPVATAAIVVSHSWWSKEHPDPEGRQVQTLVAHFATVLSHLPTSSDIPVFWDFSSLFQHPRSETQTADFQHALEGMHLLYVHQETCVVQLEGVPYDVPNPMPYHERGWTTFERALAKTKIRSKNDLNGDVMAPPERLGLDGATTGEEEQEKSFPLPIAPKRFNNLLRTRTFANAHDEKVVEQLYQKVFFTLAEQVLNINFYHSEFIKDALPLDDQGVELLVEVLPFYTNLKKCWLHANPITSTGAVAIANLLGNLTILPHLSQITFQGCRIDHTGQNALRKAKRLRPALEIIGVEDQNADTSLPAALLPATPSSKGEAPANQACLGGCGFFAGVNGYCSKCGPRSRPQAKPQLNKESP